MRTIQTPIGVVLVPGACRGGWWYEPLVTALAERGFAPLSITLAGLDPDEDGTVSVSLEAHVEQRRWYIDGAGRTGLPVDPLQWATRHNVLHDGPERVLRLLLEIATSLDPLGTHTSKAAVP